MLYLETVTPVSKRFKISFDHDAPLFPSEGQTSYRQTAPIDICANIDELFGHSHGGAAPERGQWYYVRQARSADVKLYQYLCTLQNHTSRTCWR